MNDTHKSLSNKVKALPNTPGVYMFLDAEGKIIYVGKAKRLRVRVASYFQAGRARDARLEMLVSRICDLKYITVSSEAEAFIYEAGLIKDHSPKFNVELKDDRSYPYLKLTLNEKYPRLFLTRRKTSDGAAYYGPYADVGLVTEALSFMKKVFPLRSCRAMKKSLCLEYHIGQCLGPCARRLVSEKDYSDMVEQLKKFLEGKKDDLINDLGEEMTKASRGHNYEKALFAKKRIEALTVVQKFHNASARPMFGELDELQNALGMEPFPSSIECFDISNISGKYAVGAMVKFVDAKPKRAEYRRYRIKSVAGIDDYSMIREVVKRRYSRLLAEGIPMPDLVLIDGGKGHLSVVMDELAALGLNALNVASIAKEYNHLYTASRKHPIRLSPGSRLLHIIQRVRDEAHRFAISYHRQLRSRGLRN